MSYAIPSTADFYLPGAAQVSHSCFVPFFGESRVTFEGVQEAASRKPGILCHNFITAFFLRCFGLIVDVKDVDGKMYHLNRSSLTNWLLVNHEGFGRYQQDSFEAVSETGMRGFLDDVLRQKSPSYIVTIRDLQDNLEGKERTHEQATRNQWNRACDLKRPAQMDALRAQIASAQAERARHQMPCPSHSGPFAFSLV